MEKQMRKVFTVTIHDKPFNVWNIDGKEHEGPNGEPKTWWLYYSDESALNGLPPSPDSENFVPWYNGLNRINWEIKIKERNTSKEKWNHTSFSRSCVCEIWANGKQVYELHVRDINYAMDKAKVMMVEMTEHCYNFFEPEKERGRKVYFRGLPATIQPRESMPWEINIYPDYTDTSEEEWWSEYAKREPSSDAEDKEMVTDDIAEYRQMGKILWGSAFSDQHIYWFRK